MVLVQKTTTHKIKRKEINDEHAFTLMIISLITKLIFLFLFLLWVSQGRVLKCIELMHDVSLISRCAKGCSSTAASVPLVPHSPIGVLDAAACLSYKSDDTTVGSCANSSHNKKRKLS